MWYLGPHLCCQDEFCLPEVYIIIMEHSNFLKKREEAFRGLFLCCIHLGMRYVFRHRDSFLCWCRENLTY